MPSKMEIAVAALALAICCCRTARGLDMTLIGYNCQQVAHLTSTNAEQATDEVYNFIRDHAADPGYNAMKTVQVGDDTCYGQAACDGHISQDECVRCVGAAYDFTVSLCPFSNGAHVKFGSCRFRVENYPFDLNWVRGMDSEPHEYGCDLGSHDPKGDAGKVCNRGMITDHRA